MTNFVDSLKGKMQGIAGDRMQSKALSSVVPWALPYLVVTLNSLNQDMLGSSMLSPFQLEIGTSATVSGLWTLFSM